MLCKICSLEGTDNPDGICDDCKFCIIDDKDITPDFYSGNRDKCIYNFYRRNA